MNPPAPARIALAALFIFAASPAFGTVIRCPSKISALKAALEGKNPDLPAILAKLEAIKPTNPTHTDLHRSLKIDVLYKLGRSEEAAVQYDKAIAHLREAASLCDQQSRPDEWAIVHHRLSVLLHLQGRNDQAVLVARQALTIAESAFGPEHQQTITSASTLANILRDTGDVTASEPLLRRVLKAHEHTLGRDHPDTLDTLNKLAKLLYDKSDFDVAETLFNRALEGRERILGPENADTCLTAYQLALVYCEQKNYAKALPLAEQALKGWTKTKGKEHRNTIDAQNLVDELKQR